MLILLTGSSPFVRGAVAESAISGRDDWRHLSIDELLSQEENDRDRREHEEELLEMLRSCVNELEKSNLHLLLSTALEESLFSSLKKGIPTLISIHLGNSPASNFDFDHVIDSERSSLLETQKILDEIIKEL